MAHGSHPVTSFSQQVHNYVELMHTASYYLLHYFEPRAYEKIDQVKRYENLQSFNSYGGIVRIISTSGTSICATFVSFVSGL